MTAFWTDQKVRFTALAFLIMFVIVLPVLFSMMRRTNASANAAFYYGDYPGYYGVAMLLSEGRNAELYDLKAQAEMEQRIPGMEKEGFYPFAYPPFVVPFLLPLAQVSPVMGKWIFCGLMLFCLGVALRIASRQVPAFKTHWIETAAAMVAFIPISHSIIGAQNVALSMLLYAAAASFLARGTKSGDFLCGAMLGLWCFKPHYPLFLISLLMVAGRWRVVAGFSVVASLLYLVGVSVMGWMWPFTWLNLVQDYAPMDFERNCFQMVSVPGILACMNHDGLKAVSLIFAAALWTWLAWRFRKGENPSNLFDLATVACLLASPHTLYYDLGIAVIPVAKALRLETDRARWALIGVLLFVLASVLWKNNFSVQPLFFLLIGAFGFLIFRNRRQGWSLEP